MRLAYIYKAVAICFLLFTAADLLTPHFCSEELGGISLPAASNTSRFESSDEAVIASVTDAHHQHEQSPEPASEREDCFCCCSHIVLEVHFRVGEFYLKSPDVEATRPFIPTPPLGSPFHPPRLS